MLGVRSIFLSLSCSAIVITAGAAANNGSKEQLSPDKSAVLSRLVGTVHSKRGKFAIAEIDDLIRKSPHDASNWAIRARICAEMDEADAALNSADKALAIYGGNCLALTTRANALLRINRPNEAMRFSDMAFAKCPCDKYVRGDRVDILIACRRSGDAISLLKQDLEADPKDGVLRGELVRILDAQRQYKAVVEHATAQIDDHPKAKNQDKFLVYRGNAYFHLGQFPKAQADFEAALKHNEYSSEAMRGLIGLYKATGQTSSRVKLEQKLRELEDEIRPL